MLNMGLIYKCRTKSFYYISYKYISYKKKEKKKVDRAVWDRYISNNTIRVFTMHHKPAKFIVSPHAAEFIISGVKSTNIMKWNWIYKAGYVPWGHFKYSHTEKP